MGKQIALLTDFGTEDIYVGVMKGVMKSICADAELIDITHAIQPQNVHEGAFALLNSYHYFPKGTIFLVVIDPGVGSARKPMAVQTEDYTFVAPNNGVLSYALADLGKHKAVALQSQDYQLSEISNTFHGRDIFSPAAAHLANGVALESFGEPITKLFQLHIPKLEITLTHIVGEVVHIDHFGNVITNIGNLKWLQDGYLMLTPRFGVNNDALWIQAQTATMKVEGWDIKTIHQAYHQEEHGKLLLQVDSNGYLEIAINQGNAAHRLGLKVGDKVDLHLEKED
jgi:S-adenosylmethionine hydrolase